MCLLWKSLQHFILFISIFSYNYVYMYIYETREVYIDCLLPFSIHVTNKWTNGYDWFAFGVWAQQASFPAGECLVIILVELPGYSYDANACTLYIHVDTDLQATHPAKHYNIFTAPVPRIEQLGSCTAHDLFMQAKNNSCLNSRQPACVQFSTACITV